MTKKITVLTIKDRCNAIINNGNQCSRRKKYGNFCGKHNKKQPYGVVSHNSTQHQQNDSLIRVRKIKIKKCNYLIDENNILFNENGTRIIGKLKSI